MDVCLYQRYPSAFNDYNENDVFAHAAPALRFKAVMGSGTTDRSITNAVRNWRGTLMAAEIHIQRVAPRDIKKQTGRLHAFLG